MKRVILDTHTLIWLAEGDLSLGSKARNIIEKADELIISAISFWEMAMLQQKEHVNIIQPIKSWRNNILDIGIIEIPLRGEELIISVKIEDFHRDPADRMIVATALTQNATLITADKKILAWTGNLHREDARL